MSQEQLRRMLADSAETIDVAAPRAFASPRRPRRHVVAAVAAVAVLAVAVTTTAVLDDDREHGGIAPIPAVTPSETTPTPSDDLPRVTPIDLPTNGWRPGDGGDGALIEGRISYENGCILVGGTVALWPAGFTAELRDFGGPVAVVVLDADGDQVGPSVVAGGGYVTADRAQGRCVRPGDEVVSIQSEMVLGGSMFDRTSLLEQLETRPEVRRELIGRGVPGDVDVVLCGINRLGLSTDRSRIYAWLECSSYLTSYGAEEFAGGAAAVVIDVDRSGTYVKVTDVTFPRQESIEADIRALFPARLQDRLIQGQLPVVPTSGERLAAASTLS